MFNLMGNFCSWVSRVQQPMRKVTILVVGLDKAGKTSCVRGMMRASLGDLGPTNGCVRNELKVENILVNLLDMGGGPETQGSWRQYYREAHGVIFVVDSSDRQRMREVRKLLTDMLSHPSVAGKPLLVLANKQDKANALLGSELIEVLSLEKLVNQSQSMCHIESCSALMDLRRWSDRKTLQGIRWLLRAVSLDYSELCARIISDMGRTPGPEYRERRGKGEKRRKKNKDDSQEQEELDKESSRTSPLQDFFQMESSFKTKLKTKKKVRVKIKSQSVKTQAKNEEDEEQEEDVEEHKAEQQDHGQKQKVNNALLPRRCGKLKCKVKVKEETLDCPGSVINDDSKPDKGEEQEKQKKKTLVNGKRRNKINTEKILAAYAEPADLSATFDLYRKAILALKAQQEEKLVPAR